MVLEEATFKEWIEAGDRVFYDTPQETLMRALYNSNRIHSDNWLNLYKYEKDYINKEVNKAYF